MEEDILEIISENYFEEIPKEIASHMIEFILWFVHSEFEEESKGVWSIPGNGLDTDNEYSLDEIYQYWKENIKTK